MPMTSFLSAPNTIVIRTEDAPKDTGLDLVLDPAPKPGSTAAISAGREARATTARLRAEIWRAAQARRR